MVAVDGVCSVGTWVTRTAVAGCTFAKTLMRVMFVRLGGRVVQRYESMMLTIFVDDIKCLATGYGHTPHCTVVTAAAYVVNQLENTSWLGCISA